MTVFAEENINIEFIVVIDGIEQSVDELNLRPGEIFNVTAKITPETNETVKWSQTAIGGFNLRKNGNTVTIYIADDMPVGRVYDLIASYGDFSKLLRVNIVASHTCSYTEEITKESTCAETGIKTFTCSCGNSYTEEIPLNTELHNYNSEWTTIKEPNCIETGLSVQYCSICANALNEMELPAGNHTEVIDAAKAATCTETGLTEGKHCLVCNEILVAQEEIPITGHNYIETVTDATCIANGNKHYECNVCGDSYDETITSTGHTYTEGKYIVDIEPTPQKNGSKSIHCDICDEIIEGTSVEIEYVEPDVIKEVTVTFDPDCSSLKTETITVNKGDKVNKIPTIKRTDYKFLGWYTKDNSKLTSETIILEDVTYFAKWEKIKESEEKPVDKPVDKPSDNPPSEDIKDKTDDSSNTKPEDNTNNSSNDTSKDDNPSDNKSEDTTNKLPINNPKENMDNSSDNKQKENTSDLSGNGLKNNSDNSSDDYSGNDTEISSDNSKGSGIGNSTNSNSGSKSNNSNSSIRTTPSKSSGNTTVKKRMFFISFNCTGGTTESREYRNIDNNISCGFYVEEGMPLGKLPFPNKNGYIFDCWQDIKNNRIDENTIPVRNTTYYAKWIKE
ncbi:MAG: InlB B-repeat-containing protein [Clostridia bacterium]|nr:InlB B-repeat-containing protein [Clostridia bacterium]